MSIPAIESFPFVDVGEISIGPDVMPPDWNVTLADGREIHLVRIEQRRTYDGMLAGLPMFPEQDVERALVAAQKWDGGFHRDPIVIPATITRGIRPAPADPRFRAFGPKPWQMLPPVTTFARFQCQTVARDPGEIYSSALFIWWQARFGLPDEEGLIGRICAVDWVGCATDWTP